MDATTAEEEEEKDGKGTKGDSFLNLSKIIFKVFIYLYLFFRGEVREEGEKMEKGGGEFFYFKNFTNVELTKTRK